MVHPVIGSAGRPFAFIPPCASGRRRCACDILSRLRHHHHHPFSARDVQTRTVFHSEERLMMAEAMEEYSFSHKLLPQRSTLCLPWA